MNQPLDYRQNRTFYYDPGLKNGVIVTLILGLLAVILSPAAAQAQPAPNPAAQARPSPQQIDALINDLDSDDSSQRQSAASQLIKIGLPARPAILRAVHSDDPGLREQASQILIQLRWWMEEDPRLVRQLLERYGSPDIATRRRFIREIAELDQDQGLDALRRLVLEDPSPAVRWTIIGCLRERDRGPELAPFRNIKPDPGDAPMLALCGDALLYIDRNAAENDLRRCAELEFALPTDDDREFDQVISTLCDLACGRQDYDAAADLRRKQLARGCPPDEMNVPIALVELMALHGEYGPLKGFDDDLKLAGDSIVTAKIQFCLAQMYQRAGKADQAADALKAALGAQLPREQLFDVGEFLSDHGWYELAEGEYSKVLQNASPDDPEIRSSPANVHFRLAFLAARRGDDFAAAQQKEQALIQMGANIKLSVTDENGHNWPVAPSRVWAEVHWRYLRAALAKHDDVESAKQLQTLLSLHPTDPDIAIDVVPYLTRLGRTDDASALFEAAFAGIKSRLDADPANPSLQNAAAWLCAKCDRKLDDAFRWARQATAALPDDAAVLDTLGEVNFHLGRYDDAIHAETRAAQLMPNDPFMTAQLARFKAAATQPTTRRD